MIAIFCFFFASTFWNKREFKIKKYFADYQVANNTIQLFVSTKR